MRCSALISLVLVLSSPVLAEIKVITHLDGEWANEQDTGFAQQLFRRMTQLAGVPLELSAYPTNRSFHVFLEADGDCYFGADQAFWRQIMAASNEQIISSIPFTQDAIYAFTPRNLPVVRNFEDLNQLHSAIKNGTARALDSRGVLEKLNPENLSIVESNENGFLLIQKGRASALIRFRSTMTEEFYTQMHYAPEFPLFTFVDSIHCKDKAHLRTFIDQINMAIEEGFSSGAFAELFEQFERSRPSSNELD